LSTSSDWFISVPELLADTDPAESGQYSLGELQSNELFVVSFRLTVPCHPSFPLVANSTAIGTAPILYNERKSILSKEHGKSVNCRRDGILTIEKAGFQPFNRFGSRWESQIELRH
jgi:hypothetical protein